MTSRTVNELSGTIDLESTLIRAEALFKRFQRLVDAIDKKENFPAPRLRPALSSPTPSSRNVSSPGKSGDNSGQQASPTSPGNTAGKGKGEPTKVITPELRQLLSRTVVTLPRKETWKSGEGFPS